MSQYVGIPYKDRGRDFDGCDCWGIVRLWYMHELGIRLPDYLELYHSADHGDQVTLAIALHKPLWAAIGAPEKGRVVGLRIGGQERHMGVCLDAGMFLHVLKGRNATIEALNSFTWEKRIGGYYRWTG